MRCVWYFLPAFFLLLISSCNQETDSKNDDKAVRYISRDTIMSYNKGAARNEDQEIDDFVARYGWKMEKTTTGLRYMIYHHGNGPLAVREKIAVINYDVKLLTGDPVYSSKQSGPKQFRIGHGGVEAGLEEGILLLHVGDKVKFIVPSHLAFGLLGDQNKIPPGASLVYDIELVKLK